MDVFNNLFVNNAQGLAIPLAQVAGLKLETSPLSINHQEKKRVISVSAFVKKGYLVDRVIADVVKQMDGVALPAGFSYEMGGEVESRQESFGGFLSIIIITVFLFVAVLIPSSKHLKVR
ncbi:efflux RND transporter permease subunit [Chitinophaga sedimenti]|uniref:efflux RND transporter permease subunit n=1 Tax=Chitinophaga sedimenti TaxID=2033606 RepID=UPI00249F68FA|nr:efflux RND transporter permease subunit [Chitinophaga sedimenti]